MITNDYWNKDFWSGIESGFPLCCVLFFCDTWYRLRYYKDKPLEKELWRNWRTGTYYVQCPECIIKGIKP